jgi:hypothetical protein
MLAEETSSSFFFRTGSFGSLKKIVATCFLLSILLSICLVRMRVAGVPIRIVPLFLILMLAIGSGGHLVRRAANHQQWPLLIVVLAAAIGLAVSVANGQALVEVLRQLAEIHVQAVFNLIVGAIVLRVCGVWWTAGIFVGCVVVSLIFAGLQFLGIESAWYVHDVLSSLQPTSLDDLPYYDVRERALGLSYSPVHLGTQICLAVGIVFLVTLYAPAHELKLRSRRGKILSVALLIAFIGCLVSGNRSPLLGLLVLAAVLLSISRPGITVVIALFGILLAPTIPNLAEYAQNTSGLRALDTQNKSSENREILRVYGILLSLDRPIGYGLLFDSTDHSSEYWVQLKYYDNPSAITEHALHNYYLMVLNKYGWSFILVILIVLYRTWRNPAACLGFLAYMVHIFYHNDGPLQGDFLIFLAIPMLALGRDSDIADIRRRVMA